MSFGHTEPLPSDYETLEEFERDHRLWEYAMNDYCEEYLDRRRGIL